MGWSMVTFFMDGTMVKKKLHGNIKCDCGHTAKIHFGNQGCCDECGCTWYHPNYNYIKRLKKLKRGK